MIAKISGGALIVAAAAKLGFGAAAKLKSRRQTVMELRSALWLLKNDLDFSMSMLSPALKRVSTLVDSPVSQMLAVAARLIDNGETPYNAVLTAIEQCNNMQLDKYDIAVISDFAKNLGGGDIENELKNLENAIKKLDVCEKLANENVTKYGKICKTAGLAVGVLLVIILM